MCLRFHVEKNILNVIHFWALLAFHIGRTLVYSTAIHRRNLFERWVAVSCCQVHCSTCIKCQFLCYVSLFRFFNLKCFRSWQITGQSECLIVNEGGRQCTRVQYLDAHHVDHFLHVIFDRHWGCEMDFFFILDCDILHGLYRFLIDLFVLLCSAGYFDF